MSKDYDFTIAAKPFDWNDNMSEIALEDFSMIQKDLRYPIASSIGTALAKLKMLEEQGCRIEEKKMIFFVDRANSIAKNFDAYGLETMGYTYDGKIVKIDDEIEEKVKRHIKFRFSEIEINNIDDLLKFRERCKCDIIIEKIDDFYKELAKRYKYCIKIYDGLIE